MSKRINEQIKSEPESKEFTISISEFRYLNSINNLKFTVNHYLEQLMNEYMNMIAAEIGYDSAMEKQFDIDLKSPERKLRITSLDVKHHNELLGPKK